MLAGKMPIWGKEANVHVAPGASSSFTGFWGIRHSVSSREYHLCSLPNHPSGMYGLSQTGEIQDKGMPTAL